MSKILEGEIADEEIFYYYLTIFGDFSTRFEAGLTIYFCFCFSWRMEYNILQKFNCELKANLERISLF